MLAVGLLRTELIGGLRPQTPEPGLSLKEMEVNGWGNQGG